jgi:hypothetical protein
MRAGGNGPATHRQSRDRRLGSAGALIGLFFVAVSIRVEVISRSTDLRNRAARTLGLFMVEGSRETAR